MLRIAILVTSALALGSCSAGEGRDKAAKTEGKIQLAEIKTLDFNCLIRDGQKAEPYDSVNRISLDLVNNRIDMFSQDRVWQFHGVKSGAAELEPNINIGFVGKNIAAWGISRGEPYAFFFDNTSGLVTFSSISSGKAQAVVYNC